MAPDQRPLFATYLLPSFHFPFRPSRRKASTDSTESSSSTASDTPPALSYSPTSSASTTPSSSPPSAHFIPAPPPNKGKSLLHDALQNLPSLTRAPKDKLKEKEVDVEHKLYRAQPNTLKCVTCAADIAFASQIVSKGFTGRHGRAYLVSPPPRESSTKSPKDKNKPTELVNTKVGRAVNRELLTGAHVVADVSCVICATVLGWKYVDAKEQAQRYKIGKFILEMKRVIVAVSWEDDCGHVEAEEVHEMMGWEKGEEGDGVVVFDSEDEDECEDLFAGIWDPEVVAKRRSRRVGRKKVDATV